MEIKLAFCYNKEDNEEERTEEEIKEYLKQTMFEICEGWVLHGQEPDLEFMGVE